MKQLPNRITALLASIVLPLSTLFFPLTAHALDRPGAALQPRLDRTLVVVELAGGNDGLNMIVPYDDPLYYRARPTLAIPKDAVLALNTHLGLNPAMGSLLESWKAGDLAFVLGVGYPGPNRSHFRSIAIWNSASASDQILTTGWIARLFSEASPPADDLADSLIIGEDHDGPLTGVHMRNLAIDSIKGFVSLAALSGDPGAGGPSAANGAGSDGDDTDFDYIRNVEADIRTAASRLKSVESHLPQLRTAFPDSLFGRQLELAAQLLGAGVQVPVVKLTLRGFDTHSGQRQIQDRLLKELGDGLAAFRKAMIEEGKWNSVAVMTYSEFGRRVAENGSAGTDHGTAAPMLVMGGTVNGGFLGSEPTLSDLDHGDLKFTTDFRSVYRAVATQFWRISAAAVLQAVPGGEPESVPLFRAEADPR